MQTFWLHEYYDFCHSSILQLKIKFTLYLVG
jgi:hypothetical protein